jgi:hypothetical protein
MDTSPYPDTTGRRSPSESSPLTRVEEEMLDNHLNRIRRLIVDEAVRIARDRGVQPPQPPEELDVAEAAKRFAPGKKVPEDALWQRTKNSLSGITMVSALLAVVFGILGALVNYGHLANAGNSTAYFDIAKLFAGAVVGSTGAGAVIGARRE